MIPAPDVDVHLDNGLHVVVARMDAPRVVVEHRLRAGAAHEDPAARGAAHLVEHLVFSPAGAQASGAYVRFVADAGGRYDAWTGADETTFSAAVPAARLDELLAMEAERFAPRTFATAQVAHEVRVTAEERAWRRDTLDASLRWIVEHEALLLGHPFGWDPAPPVETIAALSAEDANAYFSRWYRADRLELVIAGPVDPAAVARRVAELYARLPGGSGPDPFPAFPTWDAADDVRADGVDAGLLWPIPGVGDPDGDALAWIAGQVDALAIERWLGGGILLLRAPSSELDRVAGVVRGEDLEWLDEDELTAAVRAAAVEAPVWSAEDWVAAYGRAPQPVTLDRCLDAWRRWVGEVDPVRVLGP